MKRRTFVRGGLTVATAVAMAGCAGDSGTTSQPADDATRWLLPDEGHRHDRTWMAFGPSEDIWGPLAEPARRNLVAVANAVARFEPVSLLVGPSDGSIARESLAGNIEVVDVATDDIWMRDTGPLFVTNGGRSAGVDFNFNGWGGKQHHDDDARVAGAVLDRAGLALFRTELVLEGGGIETDGAGTALITESCVLNANRNPGWTKSRVEAELHRLIGVTKVIWLPGIAGKDITDGHVDFYARFTEPGVVVAHRDDDADSYDYDVTRHHIDVLRDATDAAGRRLRVEVLPGPVNRRNPFPDYDSAAGYVNFYVCNGAIVSSEFGDPEADELSRSTLARLFPTREIVQLNTDAVAAGGGGIHCLTQQQPLP